MKLQTPTLTLLFEADFVDGTTYHQGTEDVSLDNPQKSAFYDIVQREKDVIRFHLVGDHRYTVDLTDGHFEIDGVSFQIHEQNFIPKDLKLVYFREMRVEMYVGNNTGKTKGGKHYINRYFIGWETTDKHGKSVQHTLAING